MIFDVTSAVLDRENKDKNQSKELEEIEVDHNVYKSTESVEYTSKLVTKRSFFPFASLLLILLMKTLIRSSNFNLKHLFFFKKVRVIVSSADSFKDIVIKVSNNSQCNIVHDNVHNVVVSANVNQVNKLDNSNHCGLHETKKERNPPVLEFIVVIVGKLHNLKTLF